MLSISYITSVYDRKKTIELLDKIEEVDFIHLDLMDGKYVDQKNFEIDEILEDFKIIKKPLDVHLMVKNPENYIEKLNFQTIEERKKGFVTGKKITIIIENSRTKKPSPRQGGW